MKGKDGEAGKKEEGRMQEGGGLYAKYAKCEKYAKNTQNKNTQKIYAIRKTAEYAKIRRIRKNTQVYAAIRKYRKPPSEYACIFTTKLLTLEPEALMM